MGHLEGIVAPPANRTLTDQVVRQLRTSIILGHLRPGQHLVELRLVEQLEVSRSTVREALRRLEAESLVKTSSHRGSTVACLDPADAIEICELRAMLEAHAIRQLQLPVNVTVQQQLGQIVRHMSTLQFPDDADRFIDLDHAFHQCLMTTAKRPRTLQMWTGISSLLSILVALSVQNLDLDGVMVANRHQTIIDAVSHEDTEAAAAAIDNHYRSLESRIQDILPMSRLERRLSHGDAVTH